jgi:hypothetical protein
MSLLTTITYWVEFKPERVGNENIKKDSIKITKEQFDALLQPLQADKFVMINGSLYATSTIKGIEKKVEMPKTRERWQFDSDKEYNHYLKSIGK